MTDKQKNPKRQIKPQDLKPKKDVKGGIRAGSTGRPEYNPVGLPGSPRPDFSARGLS